MLQKKPNQQKFKAAFYGSLRNNQYNNKAFVGYHGEDNVQYLETDTIEGFELYSLGAYPTVIPSNNDSKLVIDKFLLSPEAFEDIRSMEIGAGYEEMQLEDGSYLYYMNEKPAYAREKVESGDWANHLKLQNHLKSLNY